MEIPADYGYVILSGGFMGVALTITATLAGLKRKELGVEYPNVYASDVRAKEDPKALAFNCAQRGAQNPVESYPHALFGLAAGGLVYPQAAAAAGGVWALGSLLYYFGYASGNPDKRYNKGGGLLRLATLVLQVMGFVAAYKLITR